MNWKKRDPLFDFDSECDNLSQVSDRYQQPKLNSDLENISPPVFNAVTAV